MSTATFPLKRPHQRRAAVFSVLLSACWAMGLVLGGVLPAHADEGLPTADTCAGSRQCEEKIPDAKSLPDTESLGELCTSALVACKRGCDAVYAKSEYGNRCNGSVFFGANGVECQKDYQDRLQCLSGCGWVKLKACKAGDPGAFVGTGTTGTEQTPDRPPSNIPKLSDLPKANPEHYPACGKPMLACQRKCEEAAEAGETWINRLPTPFGRRRPPIPAECLAECKNKLDACSARIPPKLWPKASDAQDQDLASCTNSVAACLNVCDQNIDYACRSSIEFYTEFKSRCEDSGNRETSCRRTCANELRSCENRVIDSVTEWSPEDPKGPTGARSDSGGGPGGGIVCSAIQRFAYAPGTVIVPTVDDPQCGSPCPPLAGWHLPAGARCGGGLGSPPPSAGSAGGGLGCGPAPSCPDDCRPVDYQCLNSEWLGGHCVCSKLP